MASVSMQHEVSVYLSADGMTIPNSKKADRELCI